ncbi:tetratricopeptide repeat protein [Proteus myxofaciens]|uniref:Beta-lactamase n=1 Tax=Proteus myxofaciens ATCC 19692 TaxID=1354337 RepID=A0A198FQI7_9GAMM|nr:SEL1-like repeat protein [Proteus myxofaciens]OAT27138.1 hypothetical protein M983_1956 [Proteus myxofaciens ATCC 19692]
MKILNKLIVTLLFIINPILVEAYPIVKDAQLVPGYNGLELRYDQRLPLIAPYPRIAEDVYPLIKKAEKSSNANDTYLIASIFFKGCSKNIDDNDKAQCVVSNYFLDKTLKLDKNHGLALFYQGVILENGYGIEKDIDKAIQNYDKTCRIKGNRIISACDALFLIYLHGERGVTQDINKAKEYAQWAADNGDKEYKGYITNWHYILFSLDQRKKIKQCKENGTHVSLCIQQSNKEHIEYNEKYLMKNK